VADVAHGLANAPTRPAVIGLGKLGAAMAAAFAERGLSVLGVDVDERAVDALNAGRPPAPEAGLETLIRRNRDRLGATTDTAEAVVRSDIVFVIVPTPSRSDGGFATDYAAATFRAIGAALRHKATPLTVVLTSTVLPGATRNTLLPVLEQESGKQAGVGFHLCYSPEFIALGSAVRDFLNPDFILIGEHEKVAGDRLEAFYGTVLENDAPSRRMGLENAELAKLALNAYVTNKITFANVLADLCERLPGGDVDAVTGALALDSRIGGKYLTGGAPYGGPCFPRDNAALARVAEDLKVDAGLMHAVDRNNHERPHTWARYLQAWLAPGDTVAVLGLAYKPGSHVVEAAPGLLLARELAAAGIAVVACDPMIPADAWAAYPEAEAVTLTVVDDARDAIGRARAVCLASPDPAFRDLSPDLFAGRLVVDFWRRHAGVLAGRADVTYVGAGLAPSDAP